MEIVHAFAVTKISVKRSVKRIEKKVLAVFISKKSGGVQPY